MRKVLFLCMAWFSGLVMVAQAPAIIPAPVSLEMHEGRFLLDANTGVVEDEDTDSLGLLAEWLRQEVLHRNGIRLARDGHYARTIWLRYDSVAGGREAYWLEITPDRILVSGNAPAGIFYGLQSLLQVLPADSALDRVSLPCMRIHDYPRFAYRGMHLDVSRHFFPVPVVLAYIDRMAMYKMNVFHWHLVDDQGWRLEIKKYPRLTQIGAWRVDRTDRPWKERAPAMKDEKPTYGGYYTQEEVKMIVRYAALRNITIIPEIEMPGHVASVFSAYPRLSCSQKFQLPLTGGDYSGSTSNYCAGNDSVFLFVEDVLSEVAELFPSSYIHIGGDEVNKKPWQQCKKCQQRIQQMGLKDENGLQSYFIRRIEKFLLTKGKQIIGWDEILEGGLAPHATVMSWRGETGGIEAARMHHNVIMTPGKPCYFDHYQAGPEGEPKAIGGMNTLLHVYNYQPIPQKLDTALGRYILGAQGNVWTEYITTVAHLEYMTLPRMPALAEVLWHKGADGFDGFRQRLQQHFQWYNRMGWNYCGGNFHVQIGAEPHDGQLWVTLGTEVPNASVHYTLDGSTPTLSSPVYEKPITLDSSAVLKAVVVLDNRVLSPIPSEKKLVHHLAMGRPVQYVSAYSSYYPGDGPGTLTDAMPGGQSLHDGWHGFYKNDLVATVDLGKLSTVNQVKLGCLQDYVSWIFLPQWVKVETSADGKIYTEGPIVQNTIPADDRRVLRYTFQLDLAGVKARFIRLTARQIPACPPGHSGEGKPGWLFADELEIH